MRISKRQTLSIKPLNREFGFFRYKFSHLSTKWTADETVPDESWSFDIPNDAEMHLAAHCALRSFSGNFSIIKYHLIKIEMRNNKWNYFALVEKKSTKRKQ